jgi:hypothetical protein
MDASAGIQRKEFDFGRYSVDGFYRFSPLSRPADHSPLWTQVTVTTKSCLLRLFADILKCRMFPGLHSLLAGFNVEIALQRLFVLISFRHITTMYYNLDVSNFDMNRVGAHKSE